MASERTPRPGGINLPGIRNSALATAALTSVALLSQTASATPAAADDGPSREEVKQRVDNLYDRAENDSGTYNATRAAGPRKRAGSVADRGRERAGSAADAGRRADRGGDDAPRRQAGPAVGDVARQWFDVGRAKLGPTVAAALPTERPPTSSPQARPARPATAPAVRDAATAGRSTPELTSGSRPALPAAPDAQPDAAPKALTAAPETAQSSLQATKRRVQRQLADARALLTARTGQVTQVALPSASLPAIESRPAEAAWTPPVQETLPAADPLWQQPTAATGTPFTTSTPRPMDATPATGIPLTADSSLATNAPLTADPYLPTYTSLPMDATPAHGTPLTADPYLTTNTPLADASFTMSTPVATDALATAQAPYAATPPYAPNAQFRADATSGTGLPLATPAPAGIASAPSPVGIAPAPEASAADTKAHRASAFARAQIGKPCVWGAAGPGSYDAAGLVQAAWKAADVALPRTAPAQAAAGTVVSLADARVGDLIFFYDDLSHVGLYVGNGTMIHAPGPGAYIREESVFHAGESAIRGAVRPA
ncbi:C40 family peptidase [Streptomyces resistomycificus]|uniref:NlpC/P60 domain-containing protein n=1 Tax=Streptomyces resistomycificus TaxID=67356 RepID=A0A0L8L919_9ACTN|nr:C40 family peptidase [Streptomyces resistomycificus]KOG34576.1 hypothetical protein ADK37_18830 [Streptomyces resistomycificus]